MTFWKKKYVEKNKKIQKEVYYIFYAKQKEMQYLIN